MSQHELALLLGYPGYAQVSKHELGETMPSLAFALAYEVIYGTPVSELFWEVRADVKRTIEERLAELENKLHERSGKGRGAKSTAHKLTWINKRKEPQEI